MTTVSRTGHALTADTRLSHHGSNCQPTGRSRPRTGERELLALRVRELTAKTVRNLSFDIEAGALAAFVGPAEACTSALLAVSGHLRRDAGHIHIHGEPLPHDPERTRKLIAVARARPEIELDERIRVGDLCAERRSRNVPRVVLDALFAALGLLGVRAPTDKLVAELAPADRLLLSVALVTARAPHVVVIDEIDHDIEPRAAERIWLALRSLTRTGITVITSANRTTSHVDALVAV